MKWSCRSVLLTVLFVLVLEIAPRSAAAQETENRTTLKGTETLEGNVTLPSDMVAYPESIMVTLDGPDYHLTTTTTRMGTFRFTNVPPGDYVIEVRARGHETTRTAIRGWSWGSAINARLGKSIDSVGVPHGSPTVNVRTLQVPQKALKLAERAQKESDRHHLQKAIDHLQEAVHICPDFVEAWNNMGATYLRMKKYQEAESAFLKALQTDPNAVPALRNLGFLYLKTEKPQEALPVLERAQEAGGQPDLYTDTYLGHALYQTGRYGEAEAVLKKAIRMKPDFPAALYPLALSQVQLHKYPDARETFQRFLEMHKEGAEAEVARSALARLEDVVERDEKKQAE